MISEEYIKAARETVAGKVDNTPFLTKENPLVQPSPAPHWSILKPKR